ncbi:hypothetical protein Taro_035789 [Colocasia esculenta]|uniref:Uncharacterized protein n=1 Tax=Colocasia esculenta TaxID=4460 RepID=A0A843W1C4_COLES|nr:hypothetical protein [Colocasia esculenta]
MYATLVVANHMIVSYCQQQVQCVVCGLERHKSLLSTRLVTAALFANEIRRPGNPAPCGFVDSRIGVRELQGQDLAAPTFCVPVLSLPHLTRKTPDLHTSRIACRSGFKVQPARRLRTCAKAKKTYEGLDKDSLVQSGVFPVERWSMPRKVCRNCSVVPRVLEGRGKAVMIIEARK